MRTVGVMYTVWMTDRFRLAETSKSVRRRRLKVVLLELHPSFTCQNRGTVDVMQRCREATWGSGS